MNFFINNYLHIYSGSLDSGLGEHGFSSSSVMSMSMTSGPDGRPQVIQSSSSTRTGPGGIRETKRTHIDSRSGTKKMAIGIELIIYYFGNVNTF